MIIPNFSNRTSDTIILRLNFSSRWGNVLWLLQKKGDIFFHRFCTREHSNENLPCCLQWAVRKHFFTRVAKYLQNNKHNIPYLAQKCVRIFVLGHYLILDAHSLSQASLSENCSHLGTDNVRGQILVHIFRQIEAIVICSPIFKPSVHCDKSSFKI